MIPLVFALLLAQDKAVVEGVVLNALTNEPLRKVSVTLDAGKKSYAATSTSDGKFRIEGVEPGAYQPQVQRQGFLESNDEPPVKAAAGQEIKDVVIKLTPQGIIAGRVVDEDGDPVPDAHVNIERSIQVNGRQVVFDSDQENTNTEGYFFVGAMKPGRYHLTATVSHNQGTRTSNPREDYVRSDDLPLLLAPGAAVRDVEIRMRKSRVFHVRGRISNLPRDHGRLMLWGESDNYSATISEGAFSFDGVAPGNYTLKTSNSFIHRPDGTLAQPTQFCHLSVTVLGRDVEDLQVEFGPGPNVDGLLRIDGNAHFEKPPDVGIIESMGFEYVTPKEDGTFGWTNLSPSVHPLNFFPPEGFYIKSRQFNHQPLTQSMIDLSSGSGGTLEIVVAPNAATVSATVPDGGRGEVALWNDSVFELSSTDPSGAVKFKNLAPGEYRIAAWQKVEYDYLRILEFRGRFDAQKITLAEGSQQNIEVKLIPKTASDAEVAKFQ
jgi:carboxypeptidase family protein